MGSWKVLICLVIGKQFEQRSVGGYLFWIVYQDLPRWLEQPLGLAHYVNLTE